jgi:hypothetical protein
MNGSDMIMLNTIRKEDSTNEQETSIVNSQKDKQKPQNAGEVRDDQPGLSIIEPECTNPNCQICFGIDGRG